MENEIITQERLTVADIAGFCLESAIWRMVCDVASAMLETGFRHVDAADIVVDNDTFIATTPPSVPPKGGRSPLPASPDWGRSCCASGLSPLGGLDGGAPHRGDGGPAAVCSEADAVWSIGAAACYMSSGHMVFGGQGKAYQDRHPMVALPVLRHEHAMLTPLIHDCMQADPDRRLTMEQLRERSAKGYADCVEREKIRIEVVPGQSECPEDRLSDLWPEVME